MSTVTICAPVVSSSTGWGGVGGPNYATILTDSSDASYALSSSASGTPLFECSYDTSAIPQSAIIQAVGISPRLGIGIAAPGDSGLIGFFLSGPPGTLDLDSFSYAPGTPGSRTEEAILANADVTAGGVPLSRSDVSGLVMQVQGSGSSVNVNFYIFELELTVTWSARSGGVL